MNNPSDPPATPPASPLSESLPADALTQAMVYLALDQQRDDLAAKLKVVDEELARRRAALLATMIAAGTTSIGNSRVTAEVTHKRVYKVDDWDALRARIVKSGEWDLLYKQISTTAMRERENNHDLPAGVRPVVLDDVKVAVRKQR